MKQIKVNLKNIKAFVSDLEYAALEPKAWEAFDTLVNKTGPGNDYVGWVDWPINYDKAEFSRIKDTAKKIQKQANVLVVIGIGGSYLGAKAVLDMLRPYYNASGTEVIFAGHQLSGTYLQELCLYLEKKEFAINVISKSGTTTEPAIAFRVLKTLLERKYGEKAKDRIYATTDKARGALKALATKMEYPTFTIPDDIGGRYSVLTAVGLLPLAAAGIDIDKLIDGSVLAYHALHKKDNNNIAIAYAIARNALHQKGKDIEILVNYEEQLKYFAEWWKQLYGESEGKDHKGIYVSSASFSTDLHSLGQMIQDGKRNIFETVLFIDNPRSDTNIPHDVNNIDGLNFLTGMSLNDVNKQAFLGTLLAHVSGGVPNIIIEIPKLDASYVGYLIYFFEFACGVSAYMLGVNPFNQPGVEDYKKNMFALLGKPGYEELADDLKKKLTE